MAPTVLVVTATFCECFADLSLVATEAGVGEDELKQRLALVIEHLQGGQLGPLGIRSREGTRGQKECDLVGGVVLVFEILTDRRGTGEPIRHRVQLLTLESAR
jgi:hypothetical protein